MASKHRQLSLKYSNVDVRWDVAPILEGDMTQLPPVSSHKIRVFLSSTFTDMTSERNALMEHVYPVLKDFCRKFRLEFQVMDLRWGIREQSHDDHTIIDFCLREIENCKNISLGPNFVILLGQKYGYRPYPPRINSDEFEKIRKELELNNVGASVLDAWFKKNTNVTPNIHILQPISSLLPHSADQDKDVQQRAQSEWEAISSQIQQLLRLGVSYCFEAKKMTKGERDKYFTSVTEYEIELGLLEAEKPDDEALCFVREIADLEKNLHHKRVLKFIDSINNGSEIDTEAQDLLKVLKDVKIPAALTDKRNTEFLPVTWEDLEHCDPNEDEEYLKNFCRVFQEKMCWLINRCLCQTQSFSCNSQVTEILQHLKMAKKLSEDFKGREATLKKINQYLQTNNDRPLVLFGESGSGKTAVIAKVATRARKFFLDLKKKPVVVLRFLGTTSHSCSIRLILGSICWQVASVYGRDTSLIPGDYPGLVAYFLNLIQVVKSQNPLVLLLDGLDQLSSSHRAHSLAWLPKSLPQNVHVILSTLPDRHELLDTLKLFIPNTNNFLEILPLGSQLSINLLKDWLFRSSRNLTAEQFVVVEEALSRCTLPLYTSLVFEEICRWCSYFRDEEIVLEPTVHAIINKLFDRVERYHGYMFVSHSLAYLTSSKNGLSDMEIEDILSLDDEVLNDVFQHWLPPVRRIPPLMIPRLQDELSRYILEREANGIIVFYWYHNQFIQVTNKRYLSGEEKRRYIHSALAHYYMGTWGGGRKKPFRFSQNMIQESVMTQSESESDRMVPKQPLDFGPDPKDETRLNYNLRKLSELPYHLIASGLTADLKNQVLFNYEWLHAKLSAMSLHEVLADFQQAQDAGINDADIQLLSSALRVGGTHLGKNPDMLGFDLLGRLLCYYDKISESPISLSPLVVNNGFDSIPRGRIRRIRHSNLQSLLHQCDARSLKHSALIPVIQCFDSPNTMSVYILEGHSKVVTDLVFSPRSNELISVSHERIAFWDLNSGELSRSIYVEDTYPGRKKLFLSEDGRHLVVDCDLNEAPIHIYDMKTLQLLHSCGARLSTQRRVFLSGSLLCRQKSFIDITTGSVVKTMDNFIVTKAYVTCALSADNKLILIGDQSETKLFEFASESRIASFGGAHPPSAMAIASDNSRAYIGYAEDCRFCVYDVNQTSRTFGKLLMTFDPKEELSFEAAGGNRALAGNEVSEISLSPRDRNVVLLNINRFFLVCLDTMTKSWTLMDTLEHCDRVGRQRVYIFFSMFSGNGQFVLSGIENLLHVWRPDDGELVHTIALQTVPPFPVTVSQNLVATASNVNTAARVWDLDNVQESRTPKIRVYEAPVDCVSCADQTRLVFVKSQYSLSNNTMGFKYVNHFGIDVWNVTTGSCCEFLPFARYGRLLQMKVSVDGTRMALLLNAVNDWYIVTLDLRPGGSAHVLKHKKCVSFEVSDSWNFLASFASARVDDKTSELKLWDASKEKEILTMDNAACPAFMHDGQHFLFVDLGQSSNRDSSTVFVYSLKSLVPVYKIPCAADSLQPLPRHHEYFLATRHSSVENMVEVSLWKISKDSQKPDVVYTDVGSRGILDVSKDGNLGVDSRLQVFDILSGNVKTRFRGSSSECNKEYDIVKMTYDGLYVMWVDDMSVKVGHVTSGSIVANMSGHGHLTCLHTMDYGYIIVVGGADGHLLTMKLAVPGDGVQGQVSYRAQSAEDRRQFLLDTSPCGKSAISGMDPAFQIQPKFLNCDSELPKSTAEIQSSLLRLADVPLTVISTAKTTGASFEDIPNSRKRRDSTPPTVTEIFQGSTLLAADDCEPSVPRVAGSSGAAVDQAENSRGLAPCHNKLLQKRSFSFQDLSRLAGAGDVELPKLSVLKIQGKKHEQNSGECDHKKEPRNSKEKIETDRYQIDKAIVKAGSVIMNCFKFPTQGNT